MKEQDKLRPEGHRKAERDVLMDEDSEDLYTTDGFLWCRREEGEEGRCK